MDMFNELAEKIALKNDLRRELDEFDNSWYDDENFDDAEFDLEDFDAICAECEKFSYDNFYCDFDEAEFSAGDD